METSCARHIGVPLGLQGSGLRTKPKDWQDFFYRLLESGTDTPGNGVFKMPVDITAREAYIPGGVGVFVPAGGRIEDHTQDKASDAAYSVGLSVVSAAAMTYGSEGITGIFSLKGDTEADVRGHIICCLPKTENSHYNLRWASSGVFPSGGEAVQVPSMASDSAMGSDAGSDAGLSDASATRKVARTRMHRAGMQPPLEWSSVPLCDTHPTMAQVACHLTEEFMSIAREAAASPRSARPICNLPSRRFGVGTWTAEAMQMATVQCNANVGVTEKVMHTYSLPTQLRLHAPELAGRLTLDIVNGVCLNLEGSAFFAYSTMSVGTLLQLVLPTMSPIPTMYALERLLFAHNRQRLSLSRVRELCRAAPGTCASLAAHGRVVYDTSDDDAAVAETARDILVPVQPNSQCTIPPREQMEASKDICAYAADCRRLSTGGPFASDCAVAYRLVHAVARSNDRLICPGGCAYRRLMDSLPTVLRNVDGLAGGSLARLCAAYAESVGTPAGLSHHAHALVALAATMLSTKCRTHVLAVGTPGTGKTCLTNAASDLMAPGDGAEVACRTDHWSPASIKSMANGVVNMQELREDLRRARHANASELRNVMCTLMDNGIGVDDQRMMIGASGVTAAPCTPRQPSAFVMITSNPPIDQAVQSRCVTIYTARANGADCALKSADTVMAAATVTKLRHVTSLVSMIANVVHVIIDSDASPDARALFDSTNEALDYFVHAHGIKPPQRIERITTALRALAVFRASHAALVECAGSNTIVDTDSTQRRTAFLAIVVARAVKLCGASVTLADCAAAFSLCGGILGGPVLHTLGIFYDAINTQPAHLQHDLLRQPSLVTPNLFAPSSYASSGSDTHMYDPEVLHTILDDTGTLPASCARRNMGPATQAALTVLPGGMIEPGPLIRASLAGVARALVFVCDTATLPSALCDRDLVSPLAVGPRRIYHTGATDRPDVPDSATVTVSLPDVLAGLHCSGVQPGIVADALCVGHYANGHRTTTMAAVRAAMRDVGLHGRCIEGLYASWDPAECGHDGPPGTVIVEDGRTALSAASLAHPAAQLQTMRHLLTTASNTMTIFYSAQGAQIHAHAYALAECRARNVDKIPRVDVHIPVLERMGHGCIGLSGPHHPSLLAVLGAMRYLVPFTVRPFVHPRGSPASAAAQQRAMFGADWHGEWVDVPQRPRPDRPCESWRVWVSPADRIDIAPVPDASNVTTDLDHSVDVDMTIDAILRPLGDDLPPIVKFNRPSLVALETPFSPPVLLHVDDD